LLFLFFLFLFTAFFLIKPPRMFKHRSLMRVSQKIARALFRYFAISFEDSVIQFYRAWGGAPFANAREGAMEKSGNTGSTAEGLLRVP